MASKQAHIRFVYMAVGIVLFTAVTSYIFWDVEPVHSPKLALGLTIFKVIAVIVLLVSAWRVKQAREEAFERKERSGRLWSGPIDERGLKISRRHLEVIRYHFVKGERIVAVFRRHWFALWKAGMWFIFTLVLIGLALVMHKYMPAINFRTKSGTDFHFKPRHVHFAIWWLPLLGVLTCFYESLRHYQNWKWTIWVASNFNFYLIREQSTYMSWAGKNFEAIAVGQIVSIKSESDRMGGTIGWGDLLIEVRVDEHRDQSTPLFISYVPDDEEIEELVRSVLPVYGAPVPYSQYADEDEDTGTEEKPQLWLPPQRGFGAK